MKIFHLLLYFNFLIPPRNSSPQPFLLPIPIPLKTQIVIPHSPSSFPSLPPIPYPIPSPTPSPNLFVDPCDTLSPSYFLCFIANYTRTLTFTVFKEGMILNPKRIEEGGGINPES